MSKDNSPIYLYLSHTLRQAGIVSELDPDHLVDRHRVDLNGVHLKEISDIPEEIETSGANGVIIALTVGRPGLPHIRLARNVLQDGKQAFFYWPREKAIQNLDNERIQSFIRHWGIICLLRYAKHLKIFKDNLATLKSPKTTFHKIQHAYNILSGINRSDPAIVPVLEQIADRILSTNRERLLLDELDQIIQNACAIQLKSKELPAVNRRLEGSGLYLRLDFWAKISSGGSYGHTCYVAKELKNTTQDLFCVMAHPYDLLDELGVRQIVLQSPGEYGDEPTILKASEHYYPFLKSVAELVRPRYIYERICIGNFLGAKLSQELQIPYIVEYNGSEISMKKSFDGQGYEFESVYLKAEAAAFKQATLINVVSKHVKADLVNRGIAPNKILVNPNGVDVDVYQPPTPSEKESVLAEHGWNRSHRIIGFTGTFGGWHGIDVLAKAIPEICRQSSQARFILIGDGHYKPLIDEMISTHQLEDRVHCTGRIPQMEGCQLMKACDIFLSPHNAHMVDSKFFGSPTKLFEYMAMGGGIIASDLEQIGEVLSPALKPHEMGEVDLTDQRAVLCTPGSVTELVDAVIFLVNAPETCQILGQNARAAAKNYYSWETHVQRVWKYLVHHDLSENIELNTDEAANPRWDSQEDIGNNGHARLSDTTNHESPGTDNGRDFHINGHRLRTDIEKQERTLSAENECTPAKLATGDLYKDDAQDQWDNDPCGSHYVKNSSTHTLEWYLEVERYRYSEYAPWMPDVMEFKKHSGKNVLEVGAGIGTDLAQFAKNKAVVTDLDLSSGHLALAQENFKLRGLEGRFIQHDAEDMPFDDNTFDLVYSNGVIHHIPDTSKVVDEMFRVMKPGGQAIIMVYAENSKHYWKNIVFDEGIMKGLLFKYSMDEIMSQTVEISKTDAKPLVKVYTAKRLKKLFKRFEHVSVCKRQLTTSELPRLLRWIPLNVAGPLMGWNLILKAHKPLD